MRKKMQQRQKSGEQPEKKNQSKKWRFLLLRNHRNNCVCDLLRILQQGRLEVDVEWDKMDVFQVGKFEFAENRFALVF
jgi:hypothetical protein